MNVVRYMSMIFRGTVEDYENAGIKPSVFMDSSGSLKIYLCDSVVDQIEEDKSIVIKGYESNGAQFIETFDVNFKNQDRKS
ncbi:MAG: hypothetical protein K0A90_00975 [Methanosarcinaceae archaeon]|nr:hypothetical protein [Methanosarcinaceae archaeon]